MVERRTTRLMEALYFALFPPSFKILTKFDMACELLMETTIPLIMIYNALEHGVSDIL